MNSTESALKYVCVSLSLNRSYQSRSNLCFCRVFEASDAPLFTFELKHEGNFAWHDLHLETLASSRRTAAGMWLYQQNAVRCKWLWAAPQQYRRSFQHLRFPAGRPFHITVYKKKQIACLHNQTAARRGPPGCSSRSLLELWVVFSSGAWRADFRLPPPCQLDATISRHRAAPPPATDREVRGNGTDVRTEVFLTSNASGPSLARQQRREIGAWREKTKWSCLLMKTQLRPAHFKNTFIFQL